MQQKLENKLMRFVIELSLAIALAFGMTVSTKADPLADNAAPAASRAAAALETAAKHDKYLFIFFFDKDDSQTQAMKRVFDAAMQKMSARADGIAVNIADPAEKPIVDKFRARGAPMPTVLSIAPTGAPTQAFPKQFDETQLQKAFVSPCTAKCMKAIWDRQSILLCVQNGKTQLNDEAMKGATTFKNDLKYSKGIEIIVLDPADQAEQDFLKELQVDTNAGKAVTVLIMPPGAPVARFTGALTKDQIETAVNNAKSSCGPGCNCH
jgi:hypothetical protein